MRRLDPEFRARARAWLDRASETPAHEAAARARARSDAPNSRRRPPTSPLAWGALAAALILAATLGSSPDRVENAPAPRYDSASARPSPPTSRLLVVELRSGTRLYVDLAAVRSSS